MIFGILGLIHFIVWVIAAFKILGSSMSAGAKMLWILVILLFPLVGLIAYLVAGRSS